MGLTLDALKKLDRTGRFVPPKRTKSTSEKKKSRDESILEVDHGVRVEPEREVSTGLPKSAESPVLEFEVGDRVPPEQPDSIQQTLDQDRFSNVSNRAEPERPSDDIDTRNQALRGEAHNESNGAEVVSTHQPPTEEAEQRESHQAPREQHARETHASGESESPLEGVASVDVASEDVASEDAAADELASLAVGKPLQSQQPHESPPEPLDTIDGSQPTVNTGDHSSKTQVSVPASLEDQIDVDDWAAGDNAYSPVIPSFDDLLEDEDEGEDADADSGFDCDDDLIVVEDEPIDVEPIDVEPIDVEPVDVEPDGVESDGGEDELPIEAERSEHEGTFKLEHGGTLGKTFTSPLPTFDPYSNRPTFASDSNLPLSTSSLPDAPSPDASSLNKDESTPSHDSFEPGPTSAYSAQLPDLDAPAAGVPEATMPLAFGDSVLSGHFKKPDHVPHDSKQPPRKATESSSWDPFGTRRSSSELNSPEDNRPQDNVTNDEGEERPPGVTPWSPPSLSNHESLSNDESVSHDASNDKRLQTPVATNTSETVSSRTIAFDSEPDGELTVPTAFEKDLVANLTEPSVETLFTDLAETIRQKNRLRLPATLCVVSAAATSRSADIVARLGFVLADDEEQVLLVDCNLAHGYLTAGFDAKNAPGVSEVLAGTAAIDVVRYTSRRNLFVVPTGDVQSEFGKNPQAAPIANLAEMISVWARNYHRVLLDCGEATSPLAQLVGGQSEAAIMVVKHPCPNGKKMDAAVKAFNSFEANSLGCVVSDAVAPSEQGA